MNAFDAALRAIFRNPHLSTPATYTPAVRLAGQVALLGPDDAPLVGLTDGAPLLSPQPPAAVPLRIVFNEPDAAVKGSFAGARAIAQQTTADLLVADVPDKPGARCGLQVGAHRYTVAECTQERGGRIWRVTLANG